MRGRETEATIVEKSEKREGEKREVTRRERGGSAGWECDSKRESERERQREREATRENGNE